MSTLPVPRAIADQRSPSAAGDRAAPPYSSDLLASLATVIFLWQSPAFQGAVLARMSEPLDPFSHALVRTLGFRGPLRPSQLAGELGARDSRISKVVNRLQTAGLVERVPDPADARAVLVRLTPLGVQMAEHIFTMGDRLMAQVTAGWDPEDLKSLTRLMQRLARDVADAAPRLRREGITA